MSRFYIEFYIFCVCTYLFTPMSTELNKKQTNISPKLFLICTSYNHAVIFWNIWFFNIIIILAFYNYFTVGCSYVLDYFQPCEPMRLRKPLRRQKCRSSEVIVLWEQLPSYILVQGCCSHVLSLILWTSHS